MTTRRFIEPEDYDLEDARTPEQALFAAVLRRAYNDILYARDYCGRGSEFHWRNQYNKKRAMEWVFGENDEETCLSFEDVCSTLNIGVERLRELIKSKLGEDYENNDTRD